MPTALIVGGFDAVKLYRVGLAAGCGDPADKAFGPECGPEGFHCGVVPTVAASTYDRLDADGREQGTKVVTGTLAALVAVVK